VVERGAAINNTENIVMLTGYLILLFCK